MSTKESKGLVGLEGPVCFARVILEVIDPVFCLDSFLLDMS